MTLPELALSLLVLLAAPGPTNALLAMAGAQGGPRARLSVLVLAAYLVPVAPLALWGGALLQDLPGLRQGLTVCAAIWVGLLALRLWRMSDLALSGAISPAQIALTTALNPKALVIGLVLVPAAPSALVGLGLFAGLVLAVSTLWLALGAGLPHRARPAVNRGGALWLGGLAVLMAGRVLAG